MNAPFAGRDGAGGLVYKDKMWLIGGWSPQAKKPFPRTCGNEVWASSDGLNWQLVKPNTFLDDTFDPKQDWEGRHGGGWIIYKGRMWIIGGDVNQGHYQIDVWNSEDGKNWHPYPGKFPWGPRWLHHTMVFQDKIWIMGGQTMPSFVKGSEDRFHNDIWTTTDCIQWEEVEAEGPVWSPRGPIAATTVFRGKMWVVGGATYSTPKRPKREYFNDVWRSDDGVHWECVLKEAPWVPREFHNVLVFDNKLWVIAGASESRQREDLNDVWYSKDGINWHELPGTPWKPRHAASVFVYDNAIWMTGGSHLESDVWKLVKTGD